VLNVLMSGDEAEINEVRALQLLADRDGVWYIVDPLFAEWRRRASPLADA
jgi:hypothetical protein